MKKITASVAPVMQMSQKQAQEFTDWVWESREINRFDPDVIGYPKTVMLTAEDEDGKLLYIPLQGVLMFDAIAAKPGITARKEALALARIGQLVDSIAAETGHAETYFLCADERVVEICSRHGYEVVEGFRILRRKHITDEESQHRKETGNEVANEGLYEAHISDDGARA